MSRLPTVGGDDNTWGDVLNDFLGVEHNVDGTQKTLPLTKGGTGGTTAASARTNLGAEASANKGIAGGYAPLDGTGKVPAGNLPAGNAGSGANSIKVYNVKTDYGAIGDGVANDYQAIKNAIDAAAADTANAGAIVYFPAGRYLCNTGFVLPTNRPIRYMGTARGTDVAGSLIKTGTHGMTLFQQGDANSAFNFYNGAIMENLYLEDAAGGSTLFYAVQQNYCTFRDVQWYGDNSTSIGFYAESNSAVHSGGDSSWHFLENCTFGYNASGGGFATAIKAHSVGITMMGGQMSIPPGLKGVDALDLCQLHRYIGVKIDGGAPVFSGYFHTCVWLGCMIEINSGEAAATGWHLLDDGGIGGDRNKIIGCHFQGDGTSGQKAWIIDPGCLDNQIISTYNSASSTNNGTNTQTLSPTLTPTVANNASTATLITALKSIGLIQ